MLSDLRVLDSPLDKDACADCGLVRRRNHATSTLFDSGYQLYDHAPGATRETARQELYAEWLSSQVATAPRSILDLGCGNGSLLQALGRRWPDARLWGLDPSQESAGRAREAGIDARCGTVGEVSLDPADLVVSVNVIEHVEDPQSFVRSVATLVTPGGTALVACPDGSRAWLELLFADHLWSFVPAHLSRLAAEAGLEVMDWNAAPAALGSFQLIRLQRTPAVRQPVTSEAAPQTAEKAAGQRSFASDSVSLLRSAERTSPMARRENLLHSLRCWPSEMSSAAEAVAELTRSKQRYLHAWSLLEQELLERCHDSASLVCFGMGEAAALLRAYAPALWSRVKLCAVDRPEGDVFGDIPVIDYTGGRLEWPVILGVRPEAQAMLARRLQDSGCAVIRWDDCIAG